VEIIRKELKPGIVVLELKGPLQMGVECKQLELAFDQLIGEKKTRVVLDLSGVSKLDSGGLGKVVNCLTRLKKKDPRRPRPLWSQQARQWRPRQSGQLLDAFEESWRSDAACWCKRNDRRRLEDDPSRSLDESLSHGSGSLRKFSRQAAIFRQLICLSSCLPRVKIDLESASALFH